MQQAEPIECFAQTALSRMANRLGPFAGEDLWRSWILHEARLVTTGSRSACNFTACAHVNAGLFEADCHMPRGSLETQHLELERERKKESTSNLTRERENNDLSSHV